MNKAFVNKFCSKFGFEIHGNGFIQSLQKSSFKDDAFIKQKEIAGSNASVIFDVGANVGDISLQYNTIFPKATVYAFEPFPDSFNALQQKMDGIKNVVLYQLAIGENEEKKKFYVNYNADTNSLLEPTKIGLSSDKQVANKSEIEVDVATIDKFCAKNNINQIDILKLDIQGGELAALKGAKDMLAANKITIIYTEAYLREQYVQQPLLFDIAIYLQQFGYAMQDIYNPIYGKGSLAWCDAIFILKKSI